MGSTSNRDITPAIRAEASAWIARLHGPDRDARVEAGFRAWIGADPRHARAFEQTTDAWESIGSVPAESLSSMVRWDQVGARRTRLNRTPFAIAAAMAMMIVGAFYYKYTKPLTTDIGEQRAVTLEDGTRVHLNTASRLRVRYSEQARRVELEEGEALFDVAKRPDWPFVVIAGDQEITALGTSFVVRRDSHRVAVTLMEGKLAVSSVTLPAGTKESRSADARILLPGERLTVATEGSQSVDRPALGRVVAWRNGLVILDETRLAEAVTEMNRYNSVPLEIASEQTADLRISGAFRAGDSLSFAQAIAATYQLEVLEQRDRLVLSGTPRVAYQ